MRVPSLALLFVFAVCSTAVPPSARPSSPSPVAECRLPVVWGGATPGHAFVSYPGGEVKAVDGTGDIYDAPYQRWVPSPRELVSPDGSRYAYWSLSSTTPSNSQIHVVDVVSGADRLAYDGATNYWPIAFAADGIYALHAIRPRQNSFEGLYHVDPAGGTPVRVRGSDLVPQARWTLVSGGSAWGFANRTDSQQILNTVEQLDLATGTITDWLQESPNLQLSPIGLDAQGRLYISDNYQVWRLKAPNVEERLLAPPAVAGRATFSIFAADAGGEWFGAWGGVWHYSDTSGARQLAIATDQEMVAPAGPCL